MVDTAAAMIAFAADLEDPLAGPLSKAVDRNWLDASGASTTGGVALADALSDQDSTRTMFRDVA